MVTFFLIVSVLCMFSVILFTETWKFVKTRMLLSFVCIFAFVGAFFFFGDKNYTMFVVRMTACLVLSTILLLLSFPDVSDDGTEVWISRFNLLGSVAASGYLIFTMRSDFKLPPGDHVWLEHVAWLIVPIAIAFLLRIIFSGIIDWLNDQWREMRS